MGDIQYIVGRMAEGELVRLQTQVAELWPHFTPNTIPSYLPSSPSHILFHDPEERSEFSAACAELVAAHEGGCELCGLSERDLTLELMWSVSVESHQLRCQRALILCQPCSSLLSPQRLLRMHASLGNDSSELSEEIWTLATLFCQINRVETEEPVLALQDCANACFALAKLMSQMPGIEARVRGGKRVDEIGGARDVLHVLRQPENKKKKSSKKRKQGS